MGHHIWAIVGKAPINEENVQKYKLAVIYEGGFAIIILHFDSIDYWADKLNLSVISVSSNMMWECELIFHFAQELGFEKYGILQTDYFGGSGTQNAVLYENGERTLSDVKINEVLKELGVEKHSELDEFDTINLGEYRSADRYYFNMNEEARVSRKNIIPGVLLKYE